MEWPNAPRSADGFSLTELLIALAIAGILLALAAPSFSQLRSATLIGGGADHMLAALHFARSSAILRGEPTVLCLTSDGVRCIERADVEASGWLVFHERKAGSPVQLDEGDVLLRSFLLPPHIAVRGTRSAVTFWPAARAGTPSTFQLCNTRRESRGRAVIVSQTGRPRISSERPSCDT
ncbi:MAG TPA: GspH/FimT family pseudopilin [Steroidobacteraceae bacterium]